MSVDTIYLIGFMGAGKTSVGLALGEKTSLPVYDTDLLIEEEEGMAIRELFVERGEAYFRDKEQDMLHRLDGKPCIVTTGGGIILREENRQLLIRSGRAVFLQCSPSVVEQRLASDDSRPLLSGKSLADVEKMYAQRLPLYVQCASITIDTSEKSIEEAAEMIAACITGDKVDTLDNKVQ